MALVVGIIDGKLLYCHGVAEVNVDKNLIGKNNLIAINRPVCMQSCLLVFMICYIK